MVADALTARTMAVRKYAPRPPAAGSSTSIQLKTGESPQQLYNSAKRPQIKKRHVVLHLPVSAGLPGLIMDVSSAALMPHCVVQGTSTFLPGGTYLDYFHL